MSSSKHSSPIKAIANMSSTPPIDGCASSSLVATAAKAEPSDDSAESQSQHQQPTSSVSKKVDFINIRNEDRIKIEIPFEEEELLGSVTTLSSPAVRTSARVIQKMKLDLIRPTTPPPSDKKDSAKESTSAQKTPVQPKPPKVSWSNVERNLFFEAINESGKDFEAIAHYVNAKQRRKAQTDPAFKTKDHVRLLYYQTFHKVTKYLRFSDEIKKIAQELYALINYGEMRKKLVFVNQKACMKLKELVYKGSVTVRVKGKNIRIKTPSCKALRKLNQLEEWQEEIKLPSKVDVYLKPANTEAWARVQGLAQNPRIRTVLPLQKRVLSLIKTMQLRWRSRESRLCEKTMTMTNAPPAPSTSTAHSQNNARNHNNQYNVLNQPLLDAESTQYIHDHEPLLCLAPPSQATIHRPMVNLVEFLSSYSICLNSYEDRIGVTVRGEKLSTERLNTLKEIIRSQSKRQRHDSVCPTEKKSPDCKRMKFDPSDLKADAPAGASGDKPSGSSKHESVPSFDDIDGISHIESSADESDFKDDVKPLSFENESSAAKKLLNEIVLAPSEQLPPNKAKSALEKVAIAAENRAKRKESKSQAIKKRDHQRKENFRPLIDEEVIAKIMRGWTMGDVGDLTIGDLYIMFGQNFQVNLEYTWTRQGLPKQTEAGGQTNHSPCAVNVTAPVCETTKPADEQPRDPTLSNKLKQLLVLANMAENLKRKPNCACSHFGDKLYKNKHKDSDHPRSYVSNKIYPSSHNDSGVFRHPTGGGLGPTPIEAYRLNLLQHSRNKQNRWVRARNMRTSNKQVVVQRLLPLQPGATQTYDVIRTTGSFHGPIFNRPLNVRPNFSDSQTPNGSHKTKPNSGDKLDASKVADKTDNNIPIEINTSSTEDDPANLESLMIDISLPSPAPTISNIDEIFSYSNCPLMSPMTMLRQSPTDPKWFDDNVNDFSLSSFLGHLEAAGGGGGGDQTNGASTSIDTPIKSSSSSSVTIVNPDIEGSRLSALADSVDYMSKFEEIAKSMLRREQSKE